MPDVAPSQKRITPERVASLLGHYQRLQGLSGWDFVVEVVPGLAFDGQPAWATVEPDLDAAGKLVRGQAGKYTAHVRVRDIDTTPVPGFDGDPLYELRVTIAHELAHCWIAEFVDAGQSVEAEERLVESAAQAIVRSETSGDARVMARAVTAVPAALRARVSFLRARISASAGLRARGEPMDPKMVAEALEALIGGDAEKCAELLKGMIAKAAGGEAHAEPDGDEMAPEGAAKVADGPEKPVEAGPTPEPAQGYGRPAARKGKAMVDDDGKRARAARVEAEGIRDELKAMADAQRSGAKESLVVGLRARLGASLTPAAEAKIMAAPTFGKAKEIADLVQELLPDGGQARARSGVEIASNPGNQRGEDGAKLLAEGFDAAWVRDYQAEISRDPMSAQAMLDGGRKGLRARAARTKGVN